jgi:hypothetical protein
MINGHDQTSKRRLPSHADQRDSSVRELDGADERTDDVAHRTGEAQAAENRANDPPA